MGLYRFLTIPIPLALLLIIFANCGENSIFVPQTPVSEEQEQILRDVTLARIIEASFGVTGEVEGANTLLAADGSRFILLGRLIGHLNSPESLAMAVFIDYKPAEAVAGQGFDPGTYMVSVSVGGRGSPQYGSLNVLAATEDSILPREEATKQGIRPFQQETQDLETTVSLLPALLVDLEGDGIEEIALARRIERRGLSWQSYQVYRRAPGSERWTRLSDDGDFVAPGLAALDYWGNVAAATGLARRWDPETRLMTVWSWLSEEGAPVTAELLLELVPDGDPERTRETQEALSEMREFFVDAHATFSEAFRIRQPWPGFINGFKKTEDVMIISLSPPIPVAEDKASLELLVDLREREGPDSIARRFLVRMDVVQEGKGWFLDGVEAKEERKS